MALEGHQEYAQSRFSSPEEELAFLRRQVAEKERELGRVHEGEARDTLIGGEIKEYAQAPQEAILEPSYQLKGTEVEQYAQEFASAEEEGQAEQFMELLREKGIRNMLTVAEKMKNPHLEDDLHRFLVQYIKAGYEVEGLKQKDSLWKVLHMTLYEVVLPEVISEDDARKPFKELVSVMEQFYAGMLSVSDEKEKSHFTMELAVQEGSNDIVFYSAVPNNKRDLFEKQVVGVFPNAQLFEQKNDYNVFVEGGVSLGVQASFAARPIYPLKTYDKFETDPLSVILSAFSKIEEHGGGAALQVVICPVGDSYVRKYRSALEEIHRGVPIREATDIPESFGGEVFKALGDFAASRSSKKKNDNDALSPSSPDHGKIEAIENKIASPIVAANIRIVASAQSADRAETILSELEAVFNQFEDTRGNRLKFARLTRTKLAKLLRQFSFREFAKQATLPLSTREIISFMHFPAKGITSVPQFRQITAASAPAPLNMPAEGTELGVNRFREVETTVRLTGNDRLRHFYVIGQTGTGKTTLLKNMIAQDIERGEGVCMIDPHGSDVLDVLGAVPPHRHNDVIYFDPSDTEHVLALNMLEFDPNYPEQKTFVVNEIFSIFQKLYGAVPESMGPMFEQYFRNAALLVLEDPSSGSTLMDISKVLSNESYRNRKLSKTQNPVLTQFWREVAGPAGGESALANIVPYITSKFDVFMANDIMRPIIAQQKSSLNFRNIMDERKILLVNLAKGRLGDINSHLLGLIIVGKILMAALSRVDRTGEPPPFYLYIDEFQNVTTDSIAVILSEARKYKLSLTVAHQFIAQLEDSIRDAVFGNVGSMATFRVGAEDAEYLERQFSPVFSASDIINIENYHAYAKLLIDGFPAKPFSFGIHPFSGANEQHAATLKALSTAKYARSRSDVEAEIQQQYTTS